VPIVCRRFVYAIVIASAAALTYASENLKELTVPLTFTPQQGVHESSADLSPAAMNQSVEIRSFKGLPGASRG
jgi:hypothetical protein